LPAYNGRRKKLRKSDFLREKCLDPLLNLVFLKTNFAYVYDFLLLTLDCFDSFEVVKAGLNFHLLSFFL
jgi:hypothetical protein